MSYSEMAHSHLQRLLREGMELDEGGAGLRPGLPAPVRYGGVLPDCAARRAMVKVWSLRLSLD